MKFAILDDDTQNRGFLVDCIHRFGKRWTSYEYSTPFALVTGVCDELKGNLELLLIHISSAKDENIQVACDLQEYFPHLHLIFYSQDNNCAEEIFSASPLGFMLMPIREERLQTMLQRAEMICAGEKEQSLCIVSRGETQRLLYSSIRYMESEGRKLIFYTDMGSYEAYMLISEVIEHLPEQFVQCHRSYIVNIARITRYGADGLLLSTGEIIPISRTHQKQIREILQSGGK